MLCITGVRIPLPRVHQKGLTVQVYVRSLVQGWFSGDRDVEKLRKPLEKKAAVSVAQKTKNTGCVNRKVLLRHWMPTRDQGCRTMPRETTKRMMEGPEIGRASCRE